MGKEIFVFPAEGEREKEEILPLTCLIIFLISKSHTQSRKPKPNGYRQLAIQRDPLFAHVEVEMGARTLVK